MSKYGGANNPFVKFNLPVRFFFCWLEPLFCYGARHTIKHKDLFSHQQNIDSEHLLKKFTRYWNYELRTNRHAPQLWRPLAKCLWWRLLIHGILCLSFALLLVVQSIVLGNLANYFTIQAPTSTETRDAYILGLGLTLLSFVFAVVNTHTALHGTRLGMVIRIIMTSTIYKKILTLSQSTVASVAIGQIVNLASNDVHRFDLSMLFYHFLWVGPFHLVIVTYFVYREIGPSSFLASFLIILLVPLQLMFARLYTKLRLKAAIQTDERVKIMNEVITGIRVIKMYGWEEAFQKMITQLRNKEVKTILYSSIIRAINISLYITILPTIMFITFSVYGYMESVDSITAKKVFTTLSLLSFVRLTSVDFLLEGIILGAEGYVALNRIKKFSLMEDHWFPDDDTSPSQSNCISSKCVFSQDHSVPYIVVTELSVSWTNDPERLTLSNISFTINKDTPLMGIFGAVGSGKSTLLQCIIDELHPIYGQINKDGLIAYCAQEPWVFSATFRDNVLFGKEYEFDWYNTVIRLCALDKDLESLPHGDLTLVGERGITLSGGQKARISLARAVYLKADIYLLDDPLSALDAAVSKHIFDNCIKDVLCKSSIVVLATHLIQYIHQCDIVLGLKEGQMQVLGVPSEITMKDFTHVINDEEIVDTQEDSSAFSKGISSIDDIVFTNDIINDNRISDFDETESISTQMVSSCQTNGGKEPTVEVTDGNCNNSLPDEDNNQGTVSIKTYYKYFIAGGGYLFTVVVFSSLLFGEVTIAISDWWISDWADCSSDHSINRSSCNLKLNDRISIYGSLTICVWVSCITRTILFYILALRAARVLHNRMFTTLLRAPVLFFDTNPVGRILNRFSKDIGFLDNVLIFAYIEFLLFFIHFLAIMVIAVVSNSYLLIVVIILLVAFVLFRWYYLKTAREIKRIEAIARSPLYSHISMTVQGLPTIRAYNNKDKFIKHFHSHQNSHTQTWDAYIVASRWFGLRIDTISTLFIAAISFVSIPLTESVNAGLVGLALTYAISLNGVFQYCIRQSKEVESYMVSVERVLAYINIAPEKPIKILSSFTEPLTGWPNKGLIEITDLSYRHSLSTPVVLKGINCVIASGEKIGIVGRTGAGKSSLIASFFRLAEPSGSIRIDGVECFNIGLHDLRTNISIIPQDPVLFSGTIRYNLDPFNQYDDEQIWTALEQVQLSSVVDSLDGRLEALVTEGGNNLSVGQRQLFCLARALLKHNKILMLDEATANVDLETDAIIQHVIRDQFIDCTVLTIAHRLDTVMDSDKIMVLNDGKLVEYDQPCILLSNPDSFLLRLVEKTGPVCADKLKRIAASNRITII